MTSKIKVDNIENQCGGAVVTKCGGTTTISGSVVKANDVQAADGGNLVSQCGTTITLGASGDTINLAAGASQSGFGRTGTVDWQTGDIKTATFTAANGEGYFANTSGGAFTMNLPVGVVGNIVSVVDYTNTFQTNALTVAPNGSEKIGGIASSNTLSTKGQSVTFVYVDATEGWKNIQDSTSNVTGNPNLIATGGTITTCGDFKIHTFTGPGTFCVSSISQTAAENTVSYMVVAGGGSGGTPSGSGGTGGGGGGGFREGRNVPIDNFTASPLVANAPTNAVTVTAAAFPITVGGGGASKCSGPGGDVGAGNPGSNSIFSIITSAGGGGGGGRDPVGGGATGAPGGSGGGARYGPHSLGTGNTPPTSPAQGRNGGNSPSNTRSGAGGGGAGAVGSNGYPGSGYPTAANPGGPGGAGVTTEITASPVAYAGGGGGGRYAGSQGSGGTGGGGASGNPGVNGTDNTGGGGGGGSFPATSTSGAGGSGIVVIRYKFQ